MTDAVAAAAMRAYHQTKDQYLESESRLFNFCGDMHFAQEFQRWRDATYNEYLAALDSADSLQSVLESNVQVDGMQYWSRKQLAKHCNLALDERRLLRSDGTQSSALKPAWTDVIKLTATLNNFRTKGYVSRKQSKNIDNIEEALKDTIFEARELRRISEALATKLGEEIEAHTIAADLTKHEDLINSALPDLENCENLHEVALLNGDMLLAEEIGYNQIAMHERMLDVIKEQYPIIRKRQEDAKQYRRRRRWAIFRMANRDVNSVMDLKKRQIEACQDDKVKITYQRDHYGADDDALRRRFESDRAESDKVLAQNRKMQADTWARIDGLIKEMESAQRHLTELANERVEEINRRIEMNEKEEARRNGHGYFLQVAHHYLEDLDLTTKNAEKAQGVCQQLNQFILDGCSNVASKFDRTEALLNEMLHKVNKQHLKQFTEYYLALGRMKYRKVNKLKEVDEQLEAAHIKLEMAMDTFDANGKRHVLDRQQLTRDKKVLEVEIEQLQAKMDACCREFEPISLLLTESGVHFVHPDKLQFKTEMDRKSKTLDYREMLNTTERVIGGEIQREREAIAAERDLGTLRITGSRGGTTPGRLPQPPKTSSKGASPGSGSGRYTSSGFQRYQQLVHDLNLQSDFQKAEQHVATAEGRPPNGVLPPVSPRSRSLAGTGGVGDVPAHHLPLSNLHHSQTTAAVAASPAPLPARLEGRTVLAMFMYKARNGDELSFGKGERIIVINEAGEAGWYYGICNQKTGLFPINYVQLDPSDTYG